MFLVFGSLGTDATHGESAGHFLGLWLPTVQEFHMYKLRTNFQLNHAICLASRPKSRCYFFPRYRPKSRCFFQDIERHQQIMKQYVHIFWHKKWRKKAHPIDHDFVTSDSVPFTEHLMFRVYFKTKGKNSVKSSSSTSEP